MCMNNCLTMTIVLLWPMCMNTLFNNYNIITLAHLHDYITLLNKYNIILAHVHEYFI